MGAITSASTVYATAYLTEVGRKYLFQEGNRIKYKGDALSQENLDLLSGYISGLGYDFMKAKPKDDYEFKYVWLKR